MRRKPTAKESVKFLGHGHCDSYSRSGNLGVATHVSSEIAELAWSLYKAINCPPHELRGFGIHVADLESESGGRLEKKRKRETITASQPTLARVLMGPPRPHGKETTTDPIETALPSNPSHRIAQKPVRTRHHDASRSEGDSEDDGMDLSDMDLDDLHKEKFAKARADDAIEHNQRREEIKAPPNSILADEKLFFRLPPWPDDLVVDKLIEVLRDHISITPVHIELCQQLVAQWVTDCNLPAVQTLLSELKALSLADPSFGELWSAVSSTASALIQRHYTASLC